MKTRTAGVLNEPVDTDDAREPTIVPISTTPLPGADLDPIEDHVSIGDRLRRALASSGDKEPLYPRVLMLKNVHPNGWQRAALVEGMALLGGLVALADRATAWAPLILPVGAAVVVKFHDVLAGLLPKRDAG